MRLQLFNTRAAWEAERQKSLGASDLARVFTSKLDPLTLWAIKTGKQKDDLFPRLLSRVGMKMEEVSRDWFLETREKKIYWRAEGDEASIITSDLAPFAHVSTDTPLGELPPGGDLPSAEGMESYAEHKMIDSFMAGAVREGPEAYAFIQVQFGLLITALPMAYITYLVGHGMDETKDFKVYEVEPSAQYRDFLGTWAQNFWEKNVLRDEPPNPSGIETAKKTMAILWPPEKEKRKGLLPSSLYLEAKRLDELDKQADSIERERQRIKQLIEFEMAQSGLEQATVAIEEPGCEPIHFSRYSVKASEYTVKKEAYTVFKKL